MVKCSTGEAKEEEEELSEQSFILTLSPHYFTLNCCT